MDLKLRSSSSSINEITCGLSPELFRPQVEGWLGHFSQKNCISSIGKFDTILVEGNGLIQVTWSIFTNTSIDPSSHLMKYPCHSFAKRQLIRRLIQSNLQHNEWAHLKAKRNGLFCMKNIFIPSHSSFFYQVTSTSSIHLIWFLILRSITMATSLTELGSLHQTIAPTGTLSTLNIPPIAFGSHINRTQTHNNTRRHLHLCNHP